MLLLLIITSNSLLISIKVIKNSLILNMHVEILKDELEYTHIHTHTR